MKKSNIKTKWIFMVFILFVFILCQVFGATCGDVNTNGVVDIVDALSVAQFYVGLNPPNFDSTVADVNADNSINIVDALQVAQLYVGLIPELSCNTRTPEPTPAPTPTPTGGETSMKNPLIWADAPDPDVIRVGNDFYMSSTSMHMMPGVPIMHSTDLVNWEIVSYVYQTLENNNAHNLVNGQNIYGRGSWATSLRYYNNTYYICFNSNDMGRTYVYKTSNIRGTWSRYVLSGSFHDPSLLFDDGRVYIIYGAGTIKIIELTADATAIKAGGVNQTLFTTSTGNIVNCEGAHAYKINGMYYIFLIQWPSGGKRIELCYRSSNLLSGYQSQVVLNDDLGYNNKGVAQGGVVSLPDGKWYGMLFQDHDSVGRIPVLVPVTWTNNWPVMGINGKVPATMTIPLPSSGKKTALLTSDEFGQAQLGLNWQWNHNPNNNAWSLTQRSGYMRLVTANTVSNILQAQNTVSQRTVGPTCSGEVAIQTGNMKNGDYAGIAAFQNTYGFIGVKKNSSGQRYIVMATNGGSGNPSERGSVVLNQDMVYLKIRFDFINSTDKADFYYSLDGSSWTGLGSQLQMKYTLDHFMGYRIALFNYATSTTGGFVDFDYFHAASPAN